MFDLYAGPSPSRFADDRVIALLLVYSGASLAAALSGWLLWKMRKAGAVLNLGLLPVEWCGRVGARSLTHRFRYRGLADVTCGVLKWMPAPSPSTNGSPSRQTRVVPLADVVLGRPSHTPHAEAVARLAVGVAIYWRDGCPFCLRLRLAVRKHAERATWVDIWADAEAAAYVRTTNEAGDEVVPTVVIDGTAYTNPDPRTVREALARA